MTGEWTIADAQRDVRTTFLGGCVGQWVSGSIWLVSSALTAWVSLTAGMLALIVGGLFIFPITQSLLRAMGRRASLAPGNPMSALAIQSAIIIPVLFPRVAAAVLRRREWFYPAMALVVGAHYFPFVFLYGMRMFLVLGGIMCVAAAFVGISAPAYGHTIGWFTGAWLIAFAFIGRRLAETA